MFWMRPPIANRKRERPTGTSQTLHVLSQQHDDGDVQRHEIVERHVDHLVLEGGQRVLLLRVSSARRDYALTPLLLQLAYAARHQGVHMLQIALDASQLGRELRVLDDGLRDLHVGDLSLTTIVQRYEIDRGGHFAQLAGERTEHRGRCLHIVGEHSALPQSESGARWR